MCNDELIEMLGVIDHYLAGMQIAGVATTMLPHDKLMSDDVFTWKLKCSSNNNDLK